MLHAYAWASGLIEFGKWVPDGALELLAGDAEAVKTRIYACARLAYDDESWLVPGVPEADNSAQKITALLASRRYSTLPTAPRGISHEELEPMPRRKKNPDEMTAEEELRTLLKWAEQVRLENIAAALRRILTKL